MIVLRFVATGYDYVPELVSRPDTNHQAAISGQFYWMMNNLLGVETVLDAGIMKCLHPDNGAV